MSMQLFYPERSKNDRFEILEPAISLDRLDDAKFRALGDLKVFSGVDTLDEKAQTRVNILGDGTYYVNTTVATGAEFFLCSVFVERHLPGAFVLSLDFANFFPTTGKLNKTVKDTIKARFVLNHPSKIKFDFELALTGVQRDPTSWRMIGFDDIYITADNVFSELGDQLALTPQGVTRLMRRIADATRITLKRFTPKWNTDTKAWEMNFRAYTKTLPRFIPHCFAFWTEVAHEPVFGREAYTDLPGFEEEEATTSPTPISLAGTG